MDRCPDGLRLAAQQHDRTGRGDQPVDRSLGGAGHRVGIEVQHVAELRGVHRHHAGSVDVGEVAVPGDVRRRERIDHDRGAEPGEQRTGERRGFVGVDEPGPDQHGVGALRDRGDLVGRGGGDAAGLRLGEAVDPGLRDLNGDLRRHRCHRGDLELTAAGPERGLTGQDGCPGRLCAAGDDQHHAAAVLLRAGTRQRPAAECLCGDGDRAGHEPAAPRSPTEGSREVSASPRRTTWSSANAASSSRSSRRT